MKKPEIIVIGSGIGGLCCAGLLAKAGQKVLFLEAHFNPEGTAHARSSFLFNKRSIIPKHFLHLKRDDG